MSDIGLATQLREVLNQTGQKCFLVFGTLLYFCRDKVFRTDDDIDIGVIGDPAPVLSAFESFFTPVSMVAGNDGEPWQSTYSSHLCKGSIDVYFWRKRNGYLYHTYNALMEKTSGILSQYTFKGIPADCIEVPQRIIQKYQEDIRYGRDMTDFGTWNKLLPQCPEEGITMPLPFSYGWCLDVWYPDFVTKRPLFGVSEAADTFTVKTTRGLKWDR